MGRGASHKTYVPTTVQKCYQHLQGEEESVVAFKTISKRLAYDTELVLERKAKKGRQKWLTKNVI